jgi:flagella basal body P-ring formation protein FlgA
MQMLCLPLLPPRPSALLPRWALALVSALVLTQALPAGANPLPAPQASPRLASPPAPAPIDSVPSWPSASTPALALEQLVSQWLVSRHGVDPSRVALAPLDARLQIQPCQSGLALDLPFTSTQTIRVRCVQPAWQLYMRNTAAPLSPARVVATGTPAPVVAPAAEEPAAMRMVVVATGLLQRGTRLNEAHLKLQEMPAKGLPSQVLEQLSDALQAEVVRDLMPGTPLRSQDIRPALLVRRGQMVMLSIGLSGDLQVKARLEALQDGRMGEQIRLKNRESGRQISGVVTGLNTVQAL